MAPSPSFLKRKKEQERQEKQRDKDQKRKLRREQKTDRPAEAGEDPDIAGIVPGPQPIEE
jgi:hypothetical protein